tara:strand:+ start:1515 stop:1691 length:177 start_codon:yes stop_codon:yes gene_type:complete
MIKGLEYVLIAYSIWLITFVIYIYANKKRKKNLDETIAKFEEKSTSKITILGKNEIKE